MLTQNLNFLSSSKFKIDIGRLPNTIFFVKSVDFPGMSGGVAMQPNPFVNIPHHGDHLDFTPLGITIAVDENLQNIQEIYDWMIGLYFPDNWSQHKNLQGTPGSQNTLYSDITLSLLTSAGNPNREILFTNAFPINISPITFTYENSETEFATCTLQFQFQKFSFIK